MNDIRHLYHVPVRKKGKLPCGTIEAIIKMVEALGGEVVLAAFVMELAGLKGREKLKGYPVSSLICYEGK